MLTRWLASDALATDDRGWAVNLAIFRIVFLTSAALPLAWGVVRWTERILPGLPASAWQPISFFALLPPDLLTNAPFAHAVALLNVVLIGLGALGVCTRWTLGLATVCSLYALGLPQNQGKIDHNHHLVWFIALLAAGPSARVLSVDALRRAVRGADLGRVDMSLAPGAALATLRYVWILFGLLYLAPGLAKLDKAIVGGWVTGDNLRSILWYGWFARWLYSPGFRPPAWLAELPSWLITLAGLGAIAFEISFIVLVFVRVARPALALVGLAFHRLNHFALGVGFGFLTPAYVALIDWAAIGRALTRRIAGPPLAVLYDGDCRLCRRVVAVTRTLDIFDALEPVAALDPRRQRYRDITDDRLVRNFYVVSDTETVKGYHAYTRIARRLPVLWPLALLMRLPLVAAAGRRIYRWVADRRACSVTPAPPVAPSPARTHRFVSAVGIALVAGQTVVSGAQLVSSLAHAPRAAAWWSQIAWPFDHYPRFTSTRSREQVVVWEPRVVLADGRELRFAPEVFSRTFGHPAKILRLTAQVLGLEDPVAQRVRSLELLRALWARQRPAIRADARTVEVYAVTYRLGVPPLAIIAERPLHRFSIQEIDPAGPAS